MYGIPLYIVAVIQYFYTDFSCSVGGSDLAFLVKSSRLGRNATCVAYCLKSLGFMPNIRGKEMILFRCHISPVIRRKKLNWIPFDPLFFIQRLNLFAQQVGLNINTEKTEVMVVSIAAPVPITARHQLTYCHAVLHLSRKKGLARRGTNSGYSTKDQQSQGHLHAVTAFVVMW